MNNPVRTEECAWCKRPISFYNPKRLKKTSKTRYINSFCSANCKILYGRYVYLIRPQTIQILKDVESNGIIGKTTWALRGLIKNELVSKNQHGYFLTNRGKRILKVILERNKDVF
jgi:hypothetical protein